jgi:hypothetical protein
MEYITIREDDFEHLLNCMANLPRLDDRQPFGEIQKGNQEIIDEAYRRARELLHGKRERHMMIIRR